MTRTTAREIAVHFAYELGYTDVSARDFLDRKLTEDYFASMAPAEELYAEFPDEKQRDYLRAVIEGVFAHGYELDQDIERYSVGWKFNRIPRVAAAIMRVAMFEILYLPDVPNRVAINEAVEIAKIYEDDKVISFINGILGSFVRAECPEVGETDTKAEQ
ncbi:MAG: transcription antitermination factor NusB [Oscillospiraceae bacterium]|nr:transcription antitermination factor NusB [Oscillospiraceae bacterium]